MVMAKARKNSIWENPLPLLRKLKKQGKVDYNSLTPLQQISYWTNRHYFSKSGNVISFKGEDIDVIIGLELKTLHLNRNPKSRLRSNPLTESYIILDAKYQKHGAVSRDYDKLQSIADRHNENTKGAHDIWHVGSVEDFNKTVKGIKEFGAKRNPRKKTERVIIQPMPVFSSEEIGELVNLWHLSRTALSGRDDSRYNRMQWTTTEFHKIHPKYSRMAVHKTLDRQVKNPTANYKAYTHDDAMKSLLTKLSKANFNGIHTGISLAKITDEEKAAIKQFPTYFKVDRKAVYSKFPDEIEGGIALFSNGKRNPAKRFNIGRSVQRPNKSEYGNDTIQKLSRTFQGKVSGTEFEVEAPEQQPERNSRLGELAKLTITKANGDEYGINFSGDTWLSADLRRNLWLSGEDSKITNIKLPPKGHLKLLGQAHFIHYLTEKKHIENNRMTEYFHEHGEVDGQRPYVYIDHEGFLHFHGGNYNIGRDGIEN